MEIREFAERVLFAQTLEEKLQRPAQFTDERPGAAIAAPLAPGRPPELQFKGAKSKSSEFPGLKRLEQPGERGRLLHFFANHELLATELMALVLLRFPDAPAAFRRGVLRTLQEEQDHTRLYLKRMQECGVHFGEIPVSGYFWRAISGMESPMDYVAGLSLTFEQANLDFAQLFSKAFAQIGDADTAALLGQIYQDEISHVAYGLHWFRRWKKPGLNDWDAFCQQLKFPLSPQRAKGPQLNEAGRRAAGLDSEFIHQLNVFSKSKGRTPIVHHFNPLAEAYIAQGRSFSPVKHQALLASDLSTLPQFLCRQDDIVLVPRKPRPEFLETLQQCGFALPEFVELGDGTDGVSKTSRTEALKELSQRKLGGLRPWAWGPDSLELLAPLFGSVTAAPRTPDQCFHPGIAALYSKAWSARLLGRLLEPSGPLATVEGLCSREEVGTEVHQEGEAFDLIKRLRAQGQHRLVVKEALGLAGSNSVRLWEPEILETQTRWIQKALSQGRTLVIEPWLDRWADFSVQMEMTAGGLKLCGYTGLMTDQRGQFIANWAAPGWSQSPPSFVPRIPGAPADLARRIQVIYGTIRRALEPELIRCGFEGPLGIDAFLYRTTNGECRLKPIVEINPRYTMGRLTLELMRRTTPGSHGCFRLLSLSQCREQGFAGFAEYAKRLRAQFPLRFKGDPKVLLDEGALCLNDSERAQVCLALFQVGRKPLHDSALQPLSLS